MSMTLAELARRLDATLVGDGSVRIEGCAPIATAGPTDLTFVANPVYHKFLAGTKAGAVVVDPDARCPEGINRLVADDPYYTIRNAMVELHGMRVHPEPMDGAPAAAGGATVSPQASVHPEAKVGAGTHVHPHATVERGAVVGARCVLYPGSYVGVDAKLGDECVLFPNSVVYEHCVLGDRVTLHANTVVGHDGFGFATHGGVHHKIPQTGNVVIEDDVELGAGNAVERAALGETRIGKGTKFADLISIGHGTSIGQHCLLVSLVGISGSVEVGNYVVLGGQVGVTGHLKIGDGVQAGGKTAIVHDVPPGSEILGIPATELNRAKKNHLAFANLYEMMKRVKKLEKELAELRAPVGP